MRTERTFFEVRSWNTRVEPKRHPRLRQAMSRAKALRAATPEFKFYITQSVCRFDDNGVTVW